MTASEYQFAPGERALLPGSPHTPAHPVSRRVGYAAMGTLAGLATTFGNGLVNANLGSIAGNAGLYAYEASLLLALYVAFNASANLLLVRGRTQFGVPLITQGLLALYAFAALVAMLVPGVATAAIVRCACGMASAALITFSIYCWMQALPAKVRPIALVLGISLPQVGMPLARMIPVEELGLSGWRGLAGIECALALLLLAASNALPMPPSERKRVLCKRDVLTYALALSGYLLLCLVLATGRLLWWTDTPWLGVALAISVPLLCAALVIELRRRDPLVKFDWLTTGTMVRFAIVALVLRLALAEQTYGAVGLLSAGGLTNDQLHLLFGIVSVAMLAGILITVLTLKPARLPWQVVGAAVLIAAGALLDSYATSVTRPPQLYLSQALLGIGTTLFIGPALLFGFLQVLQKGVDYLVSFVVMFSTTQNIGGLAGAAWLGTYQTMATRRHAASLSEHVLAQDPQVLSRLQSQGVAQFSASLQREAAVLGFNDSFVLVATVALLAGALLALQLLWPRVATLWRGVRA